MAPAMPEIETPRLLLRPWRDSDVVAYGAINSSQEVRNFLLPRRPLTDAESALEIEGMVDHWDRHGFSYWAVELRETGELIGRTGAKRHPDWDVDPENVEVGWLYDRSVWGQGLATEGAIAAVRFCLDDLQLPEVISIAHLGNVASHRVMRKAGLQWAGARRWYARRLDVLWYSSAPATPEKTGDPGHRAQRWATSATDH